MDKFLIILALIYLLVINITAVAITISDKQKAKKGKWRIKESTLLIVSALGGSVAMYITMKKIRHKTQHNKFMIGIPAIMVAQVLLIIGILYLILK